MGELSSQASNAIMYVTYGALLVSGCYIGWRARDGISFLSSNGTQKALPLSLNFIASAMGCGILTTYSQIANTAGLHGLLVYCICGSLPIFLFSFAGPAIRKRCPDGFVLTEWVRMRFGVICSLYLSAFTVLTMFLFLVGEISALNYAVSTLTGLNALPAIIVECVVTTIYTSIGGFKVSFITDNLQALMVTLLLVICACGMGTNIHIDTSLIGSSGLLKENKLGWQLIYILFVAIVTNDCFMAGFWLRTFAAKTDKDLLIGTGIAAVVTFVYCALVGTTGFIAVWTGDLQPNDPDGYAAFFILLAKMPSWVIGFVLVFTVCLSTCTLDSLQSAMVSTISNDLFRNKISLYWVRAMVVVIIIPCVVVGVKAADDVLQIYLIADLVSSAIIPIIFLGLSEKFYWLAGVDVIVGGLGALLAVFVFGTVYYDNARDGARLLLLWNGLYNSEDWGPFGAFVIAPFGGVIIGFFSCAVRLASLKVYSRVTGKPFTALDRPIPQLQAAAEAQSDSSEEDVVFSNDGADYESVSYTSKK
ncbi:hypothetical protein BABINDRAFT_163700 [Babjeviella inositovora NRRL Y-12698]|uniref:Urea transport protein n=1 Tax=Babjeviella inositovora NRRL Y-12698 TaxID=984486 RepID=A0A1E3QHS7_9ASCO|nr:uncharacterized protein BABINDRAFT_163700 [Babjeviella inositovora NRRL Y-12698]ODQ77190.1 hypothetical protein BABINDRAFT_163700 [Babjeviella inositovora NRRL Y-12698]